MSLTRGSARAAPAPARRGALRADRAAPRDESRRGAGQGARRRERPRGRSGRRHLPASGPGAPGRSWRALSRSLHRTPRPNPQTPAARRRWALWAALGAAGGGRGDRARGGRRGRRRQRVDHHPGRPGGRRADPAAARGRLQRAAGRDPAVRVADQPAVDLAIEGLEPSGAGQTYVLWFVGLGRAEPPDRLPGGRPDGKLTGRTPIPRRDRGTAAELHQRRAHPDPSSGRRPPRSPGGAKSATLPRSVGTPVLRGRLRG